MIEITKRELNALATDHYLKRPGAQARIDRVTKLIKLGSFESAREIRMLFRDRATKLEIAACYSQADTLHDLVGLCDDLISEKASN